MKDVAPEKLGKIFDFKAADAWFDKLKGDENKRRGQRGEPPLRISRKQRNAYINHLMQDPEWAPWPTGYKGPQ